MFTPPPSPLPPKRPTLWPVDPEASPPSTPYTPSTPVTTTHRKSSRRLRWTILLVPLALILLTASTHYISHPAALDVFSERTSSSWRTLVSRSLDWHVHKRHPEPQSPGAGLQTNNNNNSPPPPPSGSGSGSLFPTTTSGTAAAATTTTPLNGQLVPSMPSTPPPLPAPFPQPLDDLTQNFSSISCFNFFTNMTNTPAFRSCRPLGLLIQSSSDFLQAQTNLTLLNSLIWGTCNTVTPEQQCVENMQWFASQLKTQCINDLADNNAYAVNTLVGLQSYSLTRTVGCLSDSTTNTYCYLSAVRNPNPSDLYFYNLPLGIPLPKKSVPLCSSCTGSIMLRYAAALKDPVQAPLLTGLQKTYNTAAVQADEKCGAAYVQTGLAVSSARAVLLGRVVVEGWMTMLGGVLLGSLLVVS